jgi:hypothetical protein
VRFLQGLGIRVKYLRLLKQNFCAVKHYIRGVREILREGGGGSGFEITF